VHEPLGVLLAQALVLGQQVARDRKSVV